MPGAGADLGSAGKTAPSGMGVHQKIRQIKKALPFAEGLFSEIMFENENRMKRSFLLWRHLFININRIIEL